MSFNNVECRTINNQSIAGISAPIIYDFSTGPTGFAISEPNLYLLIKGVTGGATGPINVVIPAPTDVPTGCVSTIVCIDNSTTAGNLMTVTASDSSTIYGKNIMNSTSPPVLSLYNGGANWTGI